MQVVRLASTVVPAPSTKVLESYELLAAMAFLTLFVDQEPDSATKSIQTLSFLRC